VVATAGTGFGFVEVSNFEIFEEAPGVKELILVDLSAEANEDSPSTSDSSGLISGLETYLLNPGDEVILTADLTVFAEADGGEGSFNASFGLSIDDVVERTPPDPNPLPAPGILLLMALPLLHLRRIAKKAA